MIILFNEDSFQLYKYLFNFSIYFFLTFFCWKIMLKRVQFLISHMALKMFESVWFIPIVVKHRLCARVRACTLSALVNVLQPIYSLTDILVHFFGLLLSSISFRLTAKIACLDFSSKFWHGHLIYSHGFFMWAVVFISIIVLMIT